jgi:peptidoglycan/LPS O-acetylase OafA/YrhL
MHLPGSEGSPGTLRSFFLGLKRHTSSGLYVPELDGLRFVAIFFVFIYHLSADVVRHSPDGAPLPTSILYLLIAQLNIGVPLFFAISGMILGLPFARYWLQGGSQVSLKRYFLRRVTRLEPPYVAALLLLFAAKLVGHRGTVAEMLPHLGASLIYLHSLIYRELSSINPVAWSLEVEVQFYILAPLLALVFALRSTSIRRAVIAAAILLAAIWTPWIADLNLARQDPFTYIKHLSLLGNIQYFLAGFLLADFFLLVPPSTHRSRSWDAVSLFGWPVLLYLLVAAPDLAFLTLPWIILALYAAVFYGPLSNRTFGSLWVASIGGMCYSIYLLHNYAIASLGFLTERVGQSLPYVARFGIQLLLMTPVVLLISIVFYRLIEQPCMRSDWPVRLKAFLTGKDRNIALASKGA